MAERNGQLDPPSLVVQSVVVLIGSPSFIAGKLPSTFGGGRFAMKVPYSRRTVFKVSVAVLIVFAIWMVSNCENCVKWVGRTDLQVSFIVTDTATGQPVPNAKVLIQADAGGFCSDREKREFSILTDSNGYARHLCKQCMCFGSRSCFEDTFAVHLPWWWFTAKANGFVDSEREYLDVPKYLIQVKRGKQFATVTIPISLQKVEPNKAVNLTRSRWWFKVLVC